MSLEVKKFLDPTYSKMTQRKVCIQNLVNCNTASNYAAKPHKTSYTQQRFRRNLEKICYIKPD